MTPETLTREATELEVMQARLDRALLALEGIRTTAGIMSQFSKTDSHTHALAHLGAMANEALEAA